MVEVSQLFRSKFLSLSYVGRIRSKAHIVLLFYSMSSVKLPEFTTRSRSGVYINTSAASPVPDKCI